MATALLLPLVIDTAVSWVRFHTWKEALGKAEEYASRRLCATVPAPTMRIFLLLGFARRSAAVILSPAVFHFVTRWKSRIASNTPVLSEKRLTAPFIFGTE